MRSTRLSPASLFAVAALAAGGAGGCLPDSNSPTDGGSDTQPDAVAAVTYTKDVRPILMAKCSPCHTGQMLGGHDIGTTYADALKPVTSVDSQGCWNDPEMTMPKKIGECALILVTSGQMPMGAGCGATPPLAPDMCLSADQKATLMAWVAAGMPQ
jgi:hypothetical protein